MADLNDLIEAEDVEALLFEIDVRCGDGDWDGLEVLAQRCRDALERGRQLWPVASHVDYRLALEAPARWAASVLERSSRFTLGPLTEVAASSHTWAELAPHLPGAHVAAVVAQERILRGEDLRSDPGAADGVFELPMALARGETGHRLPEYRAHDADFPDPVEPPGAEAIDSGRVPAESAVAMAPATTSAVRDLFEAWTADSDGTCRLAAATGGAAVAAAATGAGALRLAEIDAGTALVRLTWAGASGGTHGRRRGGATGRFLAWWAAAALGGIDWPVPGTDAFADVSWWWWEPLPRPPGLLCALAVEDRRSGVSTALWASVPP